MTYAPPKSFYLIFCFSLKKYMKGTPQEDENFTVYYVRGLLSARTKKLKLSPIGGELQGWRFDDPSVRYKEV